MFRSLKTVFSRRFRATPPRAVSLQLTLLEARDVPSVFNEIWVTNSDDYGPLDTPITGSLRWAYEEKAVNITDPDYENQARIIIDDSVGSIGLTSTLIDGPITLTWLEIVTENSDVTTISGDGGFFGPGTFRFMDHSGNNGIQLVFKGLQFSDFGAPAGGGDTGDGGAIRTIAPLTLESCGFDDNVAAGDGGAIYSEYILDITDCTFTDNVAGDDGGAIYSEPENTGAGITITDSLFDNNASGGDGGAIYFYTVQGTLGIYGDDTLFIGNVAFGRGGAVYQYGGTIEAISSTSAPAMSGFLLNADGGGLSESSYASDLYLEELQNAHIDMPVEGGMSPDGIAIYLHNASPPVLHTYWTDINVSRVSGGDDAIDSNWPY